MTSGGQLDRPGRTQAEPIEHMEPPEPTNSATAKTDATK